MSHREEIVRSLSNLSKKELLKLAKEEGIPGRSKMSKPFLVRALAEARKEVDPEREGTVLPPGFEQPQKHPFFSPPSSFQVEGEKEEYPRESPWDFPKEYGDNRMVLMIRDPNWLFAYWEITTAHFEGVKESLGNERDGARVILRLYEISAIEEEKAAEESESFMDINIYLDARNWYLEVLDNRLYCAALGFLTQSGRFVPLVRSNSVRTPRSGVSPEVDEKWMAGHEFDELFAIAAGGRLLGDASLEFQKEFKDRIKQGLVPTLGASELVSSFVSSLFKGKERGFYFWVDAEVIFYGGTDPRAKVKLGDIPVPLRPDGTFTLRFSLPDGRKEYPFEAHSPDGVESRRITPTVERETEVAEPITR